MAYLGNKPVNNFVSFAKQDITGNGGTSYSLDYPVTGANDIELYINNVRQEPTEAYSCSGSTLTLTGSVSASDDVYVIFRGRALQTAQHPSDSALEASSGLFSGNLKTEKHLSAGATLEDWHSNWNAIELGEYGTNIAGFNAGGGITQINHNAYKDATTNQWLSKGSWNSRAIYIDGNSLYIQRGTSAGANQQITWENHLEIDIAGRVRMPYQPAFTAQAGAQYYLTSSQVVPFTNDSSSGGFDIGGNYNTSTYRFTAPVSGVYLVNVHVYKEVNQTMDVNVRVNGSIKGEIRNFTLNGNHEEFNGTWLWYLNANDYVDCFNEQSHLHLNSTMSQFSAVLLS
jgi:hypothetical protein